MTKIKSIAESKFLITYIAEMACKSFYITSQIGCKMNFFLIMRILQRYLLFFYSLEELRFRGKMSLHISIVRFRGNTV
jgi:hypothetical protein